MEKQKSRQQSRMACYEDACLIVLFSSSGTSLTYENNENTCSLNLGNFSLLTQQSKAIFKYSFVLALTPCRKEQEAEEEMRTEKTFFYLWAIEPVGFLDGSCWSATACQWHRHNSGSILAWLMLLPGVPLDPLESFASLCPSMGVHQDSMSPRSVTSSTP